MTVRVKIRIPFWLVVAVVALLLTSGLYALLSLDAATSRAVAGELDAQAGVEKPAGQD